MQFKEGAKVLTADGEDVGTVGLIVIKPQTKEVTHLIVQKGFLFGEDKVLPVDWVMSAEADHVTLRADISEDDLEDLPDYLEMEFAHIATLEAPAGDEEPRQLYWQPPIGLTWWHYPHFAGYPISPYVRATERNIPDDAVVLQQGDDVISSDGEHVGDVERLFTEPIDERVTHLLISEGLIFKEKKLVPITWVNRVAEGRVYLTVDSDFLDRLEAYEAES